MIEKAEKIVAEFNSLESDLADPAIFGDAEKLKNLSQKRKSLEPTFELAKKYIHFWTQKEDAEQLLKSEKDSEMLILLKSELESAKSALPDLESELKLKLIPKDPNDEKNAIVEIRAGVGGEEAALFADEIGRMILRFCEKNNFSSEIISEARGDSGGVKEMILKISGFGVFWSTQI